MVFAASMLFFGICLAQKPVGKPNIVIIVADDLGWGDVGFHGSEIKTPNIDKLSREGLVLNRFYTAPVCSPTRAGLMTGRYPDRFGLRETVIPPWSGFGVDTEEKFLPQYLKEAGYKNRAVLGKWHLGHAKKEYLPLSRGFTHFYGHYNGAIDYFTHEREGEPDWHNDEQASQDKGYSTELITSEALKNITDYKNSPFLLYVAYNAPHGPLQAKKEDMLLYGYDESKPEFDGSGDGEVKTSVGKGNTKRQTYSAMVTCMDRGIGQILDRLRTLGLEKNTIVFFMSDNGAAPGGGSSSGELRGTKFQEWEGGVRAPAIIKWPAQIKGGTGTDQVSGYIDLLPSLLSVAGTGFVIEKPFDGIDIMPVLTGKKSVIKRNLYLGHSSIVNDRWKLVNANHTNKSMKEEESGLFEITKDISETTDLKKDDNTTYEKLLKTVSEFDNIKSKSVVAPFGEGRKGFKAPKNWLIE